MPDTSAAFDLSSLKFEDAEFPASTRGRTAEPNPLEPGFLAAAKMEGKAREKKITVPVSEVGRVVSLLQHAAKSNAMGVNLAYRDAKGEKVTRKSPTQGQVDDEGKTIRSTPVMYDAAGGIVTKGNITVHFRPRERSAEEKKADK